MAAADGGGTDGSGTPSAAENDAQAFRPLTDPAAPNPRLWAIYDGGVTATNRQIVERYWDAHFRRDWEAMATFFAADCHYTDVGLDPTGATGPDEIIKRLRLGIEPLSGYVHYPKHMVAEGDIVITEHMEQWQFETGEVIDHPFTSVMEVHDTKISRWHDYSHLGNLLDQAPAWWLEHIANGWRE